jgi:nitrogen fixation NifU-like protein
MSDDLRELYQEVILDHGKNPRNLRQPEETTHSAHGHNPLCGDQLDVFLNVGKNGLINDVTFEGRGCAISVASASLMTEVLRGKTEAQAKALFDNFHEMCAGGEDGDANAPDPRMEADVDRLQVLSGVRQFPMRVKCATLAWHTMRAAMEGRREVNIEDED